MLQRLTGADRDAEDLSREPQYLGQNQPARTSRIPLRGSALRRKNKAARCAAKPNGTPAKSNNPVGRTDNTDGGPHIALFEKCNNLSQCADSLVSNYRRENWGRTGISNNASRLMHACKLRVSHRDTRAAITNIGCGAARMAARQS